MASYRRSSLAASLALTVIVLVPALVIAQPPEDCDTGKMFVQATHVGQQGNHKGLRADVWVGAPDNDCARISSVNIHSGTGNGFIEWGWSLGYLWDTSVGGACPSGTVYHSSPTRYVIWRPNNGGYHCRPNEGSVTSGNRKRFALRDTDQDTEWVYVLEGLENGTVNVNFSRGIVTTSSERHRPADSAYAEFYDIDFLVSGDNTWYSFNLTQESWMQEDDEYHCREINPDDEEVRKLPNTC